MSSSKQLYIKSGPIKSGKTATLTEFWHNNQEKSRFGGFLCHDKTGLAPDMATRFLLLLHNNKEQQLQLHLSDDEFQKQYDQVDCIACRNKFVFSKAVFKEAQDVMVEQFLSPNPPDFLIVDEIGPLEIKQQQGLEQGFQKIVKALLEKKNTRTKVIVVVREKLVDEFKTYYGLENIEIGQFEELNQ